MREEFALNKQEISGNAAADAAHLPRAERKGRALGCKVSGTSAALSRKAQRLHSRDPRTA